MLKRKLETRKRRWLVRFHHHSWELVSSSLERTTAAWAWSLGLLLLPLGGLLVAGVVGEALPEEEEGV